jgi:hypothetical protein
MPVMGNVAGWLSVSGVCFSVADSNVISGVYFLTLVHFGYMRPSGNQRWQGAGRAVIISVAKGEHALHEVKSIDGTKLFGSHGRGYSN